MNIKLIGKLVLIANIIAGAFFIIFTILQSFPETTLLMQNITKNGFLYVIFAFLSVLVYLIAYVANAYAKLVDFKLNNSKKDSDIKWWHYKRSY